MVISVQDTQSQNKPDHRPVRASDCMDVVYQEIQNHTQPRAVYFAISVHLLPHHPHIKQSRPRPWEVPQVTYLSSLVRHQPLSFPPKMTQVLIVFGSLQPTGHLITYAGFSSWFRRYLPLS